MWLNSYVHVFNIHIRLLLQLCDNIFVESLELQRENTHLTFIATYVIMHFVSLHNVLFSHMATAEWIGLVEYMLMSS